MQKVLFVCVGNSCRSQMAEGFANVYGADTIRSMSAGLYPAGSVSGLTREVMADRDIHLDGHFPKGIKEVPWEEFDVIANMSGHMLPYDTKARVLHWQVEDPIGAGRPTYEAVAEQIEGLVKQLIAELRDHPPEPRPARKSLFGLWD